MYELYGVINHHGGLLGGHYTAYARCPGAKLNGIGGYRLNDRSPGLMLLTFASASDGICRLNGVSKSVMNMYIILAYFNFLYCVILIFTCTFF